MLRSLSSGVSRDPATRRRATRQPASGPAPVVDLATRRGDTCPPPPVLHVTPALLAALGAPWRRAD